MEPARIAIVGDDPDELEAALREGLAVDLCLVSGGLGPTHDDCMVELVARVAGRELVVDEELEAEIEAVSRAIAERLRRPYADFAPGVRKQATLPEGALALGVAGTAPALVLEAATGPVVVLPGPPSELKRLWPRALESEPVRRVLARTQPPERRVLRFFGASESEIARALEEAGEEGDGVAATICARDFEIHVDLIVEPGGERAQTSSSRACGSAQEATSSRRTSGPSRSWCWKPAASVACPSRPPSRAPGARWRRGLPPCRARATSSSAPVAYADEVKAAELGVLESVLRTHGAVSAEAAAAMATGARARLRADVAVAVTGIAGPGPGPRRSRSASSTCTPRSGTSRARGSTFGRS